MRFAALLVLIAACEKQGPVESTPGAGSSSVAGTATPTVKAIDAGVATIGTDATPVAPPPADAAVVAVSPDAAVRRPRVDSVQVSDADARAMAALLSADDSNGKSYGDMSSRRPGTDLDKAIEDVRNGRRTVSIGAGRGPRVATGSGPKVDGPDPTPRPVDAPRGRITIASKQAFDESTLFPEVVVAKISAAYMAGLKRCYKTYLQKDATARGKINLSLTVNETGRSVAPRVSGFAGPIDECIESQMASWRFPIPRDKDGETTDAAFLIGLQLVPD